MITYFLDVLSETCDQCGKQPMVVDGVREEKKVWLLCMQDECVGTKKLPNDYEMDWDK